ncbi:MAG TPA: RNA methyltransferase [Thermoanaerobaculia bacterium]|nr:RNA methyltransferase [Thermoanaerobaculia bacterium]
MITSKDNASYKRVRTAMREHGHEIVIEGPKAVADAIAAGWKPVPLPTFSPTLLKSITDTKTSQGVIGLFERPRWKADQIFSRGDALVIALDGVQDPGNVGTIVRLAAAFDAAGIILLPGCADPFGPKAIRASAGAILNVPIVSMTADALLATGRPMYVADAAGSTNELPTGVLVLGSEGQGVSPVLRKRARAVAIETSGRVESLNVAAATAIFLWRGFRNRTGA